MKNELLPIIKKDSIFDKIKKFFKNLFVKEKYEETLKSIEKNLEENNTIKIENDFLDNIKVSEINFNIFQENQNKKEFIKQLEKDTSLLENLSIDRLEKLDKYYDELIENEKLKLKKLSAN